jgi:formylglycine-generating enzyme required for sulfatase activity
MGNAFNEGYSDELPVHTVMVSAFWMDKYEVAKGLWNDVATWAAANGYDILPSGGSGKAADHPVYDVSWYEAVEVGQRAERKGGTHPVLHGGPDRVPRGRKRP